MSKNRSCQPATKQGTSRKHGLKRLPNKSSLRTGPVMYRGLSWDRPEPPLTQQLINLLQALNQQPTLKQTSFNQKSMTASETSLNSLKRVRSPGFEPGSSTWQADVLNQARLRPLGDGLRILRYLLLKSVMFLSRELSNVTLVKSSWMRFCSSAEARMAKPLIALA